MQNEAKELTALQGINPQPEENDSPIEIDLMALLLRYLRKAYWIVIGALIGAIIAGYFAYYVITPVYSATAKLYIVGSDTKISLSDLQIGTNLTGDYKEIFKNWHVHELVNQRLGTDYSYKTLSNMVSVSNPANTHVLYISVKSENPAEAKTIANAYAKVAKEFIAAQMDMREPNIFEEAKEPTEPVFPNRIKIILLGFVAGALIVMAVITVRFLSDDRILSREDITQIDGLSVLGIIPDLNTVKDPAAQKHRKTEGRSSEPDKLRDPTAAKRRKTKGRTDEE